LSREFCVAPENGLACPDVVFYLDVGDVQVAANRGAFGEEVYERVDTQRHVKKVYEDFAYLPYWRRVDATQTVDVLAEKIASEVLDMVEAEKKNHAEVRLLSFASP